LTVNLDDIGKRLKDCIQSVSPTQNISKRTLGIVTMSFTKFINATLATAAITLIASLSTSKANAYEVGLCQAASDQLYFIDESGQSGYYSPGEQFPCTTPDNQTLVGVVNDRLVVITDGVVSINGYTAVFQNGQGVLVEGGSSSYDSGSGSFGGVSTTDYVDSAVYDYGYRTWGGSTTYETYEPSYPY
jgi:hypothetical protein